MGEGNLINQESAKTEFLLESARFKTFKNWPYGKSAKCNSVKMAAAGWYCTSEDPDDPSAKCAICLKELNGWEITDDPWEEHLKHSADCEFLKLVGSETKVTIKIMIRLLEARLLKIMEKQYLEDIKKLEDIREKIIDQAKKSYGSSKNKE